MDGLTAHAGLSRRTVVTAAASLALAPLAASPQRAQAAPGEAPALRESRPVRAPELQAQTLDGQTRTLADFKGHALVVNFWATWCAPCLVELPSLNAAAERLSGQGLRLVTINHGEMPERVRRFLAQVPIHGDALLDRSLSQLPAWGARGLPASFILDRSHRPRLMALGEIDWLSPQALSALQAAVAT